MRYVILYALYNIIRVYIYIYKHMYVYIYIYYNASILIVYFFMFVGTLKPAFDMLLFSQHRGAERGLPSEEVIHGNDVSTWGAGCPLSNWKMV